MAFDQNALPPIPFKVKVLTPSGHFTEPWNNLLKQLWVRVGGAIALSNTELEQLQATDLVSINNSISSLNTSVTSLTASIASLTTQISDLEDDLGQGRQL